MNFEIIGEIENIEIIASGNGIRNIHKLRKKFGFGRWRKIKGNALVILENGNMRRAEIHWYEAHGIGRKIIKIKRFID